ncbi:porin [Pseudidiomarina sp. 1APP75-27a]|uniref:DcaP family trimeric outer membrane transporter n=1 Tax=Pseudidiomarina terrestris TaxID=2820060 RepID=UPI002B05C31B|nr:DcaP family trimeric outer membrane transporter [Pseudidiomarina sp. 1APP75-27a]MEA3587605.1 porin [Pseudidiomarina sp. 1APP75-27a]
MLQKTLTKSLIASAVVGVLAMVPAHAAEPEWDFGGYIKLDAFVSDYQDGQAPTTGFIGRQFYIPSTTPVGGNGDDTVTDVHARQSRFFFNVSQDLDNGETIKARIELDFMTVPVGDERITNSYAPRLRQAYFTYSNWLVGQAWSNFQNLAILPESVDFIGATDGIIFMRQPQVRYTQGGFSVSLENPETTVTPYGGGGRITSSDGVLPDFTAKYVGTSGDFSYSIAGLVRQLTHDVGGDGNDETVSGYGVSVGAKWQLGQHDLRASVQTGSGLGRYLGLNLFNGAVIDASGDLESIDSSGVTLAYRHVWNDTTRTNLVFSRGWADHDVNLTGNAVTEYTQRIGANLMYSPVKNVTFGAELSRATRETEAGTDGDMSRLQFMAMYSF